ncbi:hypothetical protein [Kaistella palustris]|uniref:hypothetical protein n=1 Tax=Kaistella palustris TaxID=493376 RepID=UPI0004237FB5|nr:hypothetical protein [Kaistella palustris]
MIRYFFTFLFFSSFAFAQNVILNKVVKTHPNTDRFLYKISPEDTAAEYLGEIEVQGYSDDDVKVFGMIYKKAKEVGANAFAFKPFESLEGGNQKFDPAHYRLALYYLEPTAFPAENNMVYLISSPYKKQNIAVNKATLLFPPRSFTKRKLSDGEILTVSTKKLLGSTIQLSGQKDQPAQYFQISGFSVNSNPYGSAGINLKSGDIIRVEQSFGQFLTTIYQEIK